METFLPFCVFVLWPLFWATIAYRMGRAGSWRFWESKRITNL